MFLSCFLCAVGQSLIIYVFMPCLFSYVQLCLTLDCGDLSPFTPVTDEDSVVFSKLTYLGCASVNAPRSEVEALRMMCILRSQCQISLDVTLSVPNVSEGTVRYEAHSVALWLCPLDVIIFQQRE